MVKMFKFEVPSLYCVRFSYSYSYSKDFLLFQDQGDVILNSNLKGQGLMGKAKLSLLGHKTDMMQSGALISSTINSNHITQCSKISLQVE